MASILLKALLDLLKDVSGDALVEIAKNPRTKAVIEDSKFAYSEVKAALEEDPFTAGLALITATLVVATIGPEVLAAAGAAGIVFEVVSFVGGIVGLSAEASATISSMLVSAVFEESLEKAYFNSVRFANILLSELGGGSVAPHYSGSFGSDSSATSAFDGEFWRRSGLVVRSAGRPARSRECKSLTMKD
jgi:hypothetical protein